MSKEHKTGLLVITEDGPGKIVGMNMRKNTNGGPGVRQLVVQLDDGRIRHYSTGKVYPKQSESHKCNG